MRICVRCGIDSKFRPRHEQFKNCPHCCAAVNDSVYGNRPLHTFARRIHLSAIIKHKCVTQSPILISDNGIRFMHIVIKLQGGILRLMHLTAVNDIVVLHLYTHIHAVFSRECGNAESGHRIIQVGIKMIGEPFFICPYRFVQFSVNRNIRIIFPVVIGGIGIFVGILCFVYFDFVTTTNRS